MGVFFSNWRFPPPPPRQLLLIIVLEFDMVEFCPFWAQNHDIGTFISYKRFYEELKNSIVSRFSDADPTMRFKKGRLRTWKGRRNYIAATQKKKRWRGRGGDGQYWSFVYFSFFFGVNFGPTMDLLLVAQVLLPPASIFSLSVSQKHHLIDSNLWI